MLQVHWPFTDQNTAELTPPYQKTWEAMEEVQKEVRHLLGLRIRCAWQRLSVPCGLARGGQHRWGAKDVEESCSGRAPAPQLVCRWMPARILAAGHSLYDGSARGAGTRPCCARVQCLLNGCRGKTRGNWQVGAAFDIELLL